MSLVYFIPPLTFRRILNFSLVFPSILCDAVICYNWFNYTKTPRNRGKTNGVKKEVYMLPYIRVVVSGYSKVMVDLSLVKLLNHLNGTWDQFCQ